MSVPKIQLLRPHLTSYVSARWSPSFTPYDNAALWQAALTFGVLEAITDITIPEAQLLEKQPDGTVVFTCRNISTLVYHWFSHVFGAKGADSSRKKHSFEILLRALNALSTECEVAGGGIFNSLSGLPQNHVDDIICTINLLLLSLRHPLQHSYVPDASRDQDISSNSMRRAVNIFLQRMVADGWCPSLRHQGRASPQYWWYASQFKPFIRHNQREHINCSESNCVVHSINEADYKTLHTTPECACSFLSPCMNSLSQILRSGRIPVMAYAGGALVVHPASKRLPYVALSHVWVDGLGSSTEDGLPTCHIERIHRYVRELLGPTAIPAFWIDGLCIPKAKELRNKAIVMMRQTYEAAAKVLVFDSSIRTLCSSANPVEGNVFRIGSSIWMQRVWTLQEALLARELYFEFSTGIASAFDLRRTLDQRAYVGYGVAWLTNALAIGSYTSTGYLLAPAITGRKPDFIEIMALLSHRSTSKPKDEPLAIAGLLKVDPGKILSQSDLAARIWTLFVEVGTLPRDFVFGEYERMKTPGFRWCPTTLTSIGQLFPDSPQAVCTLDGLTTKTEILILCLPRIEVFEGMESRIYVNVPSIRGFYGLQKLLDRLSKHSSCSINALLLRSDKLLALSMGTSTKAVAVNILNIEDARHTQTDEDVPLRCEYVMKSSLLGYGEGWDPVMEGYPMLEGRLIRAKVTIM